AVEEFASGVQFFLQPRPAGKGLDALLDLIRRRQSLQRIQVADRPRVGAELHVVQIRLEALDRRRQACNVLGSGRLREVFDGLPGVADVDLDLQLRDLDVVLARGFLDHRPYDVRLCQVRTV